MALHYLDDLPEDGSTVTIRGVDFSTDNVDHPIDYFQRELNESGVYESLSKCRWDVLKRINFLSVNEQGYCYESVSSMARQFGRDTGAVSKDIKWLVDNGLVTRKDGHSPKYGKRPVVVPDFGGCRRFKAEWDQGADGRAKKRSEDARTWRRERRRRDKEEERAAIEAEIRSEIAEDLAAAEKEKDRKERESVIADELVKRVDRRLEEIRAAEDRLAALQDQIRAAEEQLAGAETSDVSTMDNASIERRFNAASTSDRVAILKSLVNEQRAPDQQLNGDFDPSRLYLKYGSPKKALQQILSARSGAAVHAN